MKGTTNTPIFDVPPEWLLSREIERLTGTRIDPAKLKATLADHWARLSVLAHAVHDAAEAERPKGQENPNSLLRARPKTLGPWPPTPGSAA